MVSLLPRLSSAGFLPGLPVASAVKAIRSNVENIQRMSGGLVGDCMKREVDSVKLRASSC